MKGLTVSLLISFLFGACSASSKVYQGNDGGASSYNPNDLTSASVRIFAETGGYINVGKAQLRIPAQALDSDTTITAEVVDIELPAGGAKAIGKGIHLKPEGLQFLKPAELMLCYSATEASNLNMQDAQIYYHRENDQYIAVAGATDPSANCVKSHIEHFSSYVAAAFTQVPGNTAPAIGGANFLPAIPLAGTPLRVRTAINDVNGGAVPGVVVTAFFYYRAVGSATFTKVTLQPDSTDDTVTNRYYYLIPANDITTSGIEYYFEATDNLNVMRRLPAAAGTFLTRTVPTAATALRLNPTGNLQISAGFSRAFTLQATDDGTTWQNISADSFSLSSSGLGTLVRTAPSTIRFNATGALSGTINANAGSLNTSVSVNVVPGLLTHIEITDLNQVALTGILQLPAAQTYDFDVVGYDSYGNVAQVYPAFTATGGIGTLTVDISGAHLATSSSAATGSIVANLSGLTDTLSISIYVPPRVTATAPFDNTTGIALNLTIGVSFSHIMDTSTLTTTTTTACVGSLQVSSDDFATCVPMASATPGFLASNTFAVIQPAVNLSGTTTYRIRVTTAARDEQGHPLTAVYTTPTGFTTVAAAWVLTSNLARGRARHTATLLLDGRVLVAGGENGGAYLSTVELFNPAGNGGIGSFVPTTTLSTVRSFHTATRLFDGRVLIVGGGTPSFPLASAEVFDPAANAGTGDFTTLAATLSQPRGIHQATLLHDGRVLITGGHDGVAYYATTEIFDPNGNAGNGSFTTIAPLNVPRAFHTATLLLDGRVLVAGGLNASGPLGSVEVFDPSANGGLGRFSISASLAQPKYGHAAQLLPDGRVMIAGGFDPSVSVLYSNIEIFDPAGNAGSGSFSPAVSLTQARIGHTLTLLANGTVLIAGGYDGVDGTRAVEIFNPAGNAGNGIMMSTPAMSFPRLIFTTTLLLDGRVVAIGGNPHIVNPDTPQVSAETYQP